MSEEKTKPKTISEKEQETLAFWQKNEIFQKSVETPAGGKPKSDFSFYDGPPFATGLPHHGSLMAGTVKDLIPRYQTMKGNRVRRMWGWDCHGLPIENLIEKKLGLKSKKDIEDYGIGKFNKDAYNSVLQYEEEWRNIIPRMGRWVDMKHPYKTMDATYTESIWWAWKELYEKGLAFEGNKMMHICPRCETPLAQSEVGLEYHDLTDISVTAKFELVDEPNTFVLAWTTTPWTLPGNTALAIKKDAEYVKVKAIKKYPLVTNAVPKEAPHVEEYFILAKEKFEEYKKIALAGEYSIFNLKEEFAGSKLEGKRYKPVFPYFKDVEIDQPALAGNKENIYKIWHADFITLDTGTGIAHEAPAFGADDMELAKTNKIPIIKHVKMDGTYIDAVKDFAGMKVKTAEDNQSADIEIVKYLAHAGLLFEKHKIVHPYPLCWRCSTPLLNYATSSWFVDVPKMKDKLVKENQKIKWVPEHIKDGRFGKWLEGAREWAVSRTRYWGAPLPVWKSEDGDFVMIGSLKELAEKNKRKPKNNYYVMRHGQSESNVKKILETKGDPENHLTAKGIEESKECAEKLKDLNIDRIVVSPFLRAQETAKIVADILGVKDVVTDERVRETNIGKYDGWKIEDYLKENGILDFLRYAHRPEGGETHKEMMDRMMACLYDEESKHSGKNILFITHGGPARMLIVGACLATEEEVIEDEARNHTVMYLKNNEIKKLDLKLVPRDETGTVNLHRPYIDEVELEIDGKTYKRIPDVFDCWFESGAMPFASIHYPFENKVAFKNNFPAEFIAESMDQTRGWFYSLINLGVGLFDKAPYKHVICNGIINTADGTKMSKSLNNYTDPLVLVEKYGADAFRYYLMSSPVVKGENINFKDEDLEELYKKIILRMENVLSLFEMNRPDEIKASSKSKDVLDLWIISRVHELLNSSTDGYESYKLDEATRPIEQFVDDLSVWYVRRSRDRLKGNTGEEDEINAQETLAYVLQTFAKIVAPVMPFIAERIYKQTGGEKESVHLEKWPEEGKIHTDVIANMKKVREIVSLGLMKRTESKIPVRQPLASVTLNENIGEKYHVHILEELNVKNVAIEKSDVFGVNLDTNITPELQLEGDIRNIIRAVQDARKEKGLSTKDIVPLKLESSRDLGDLSVMEKTCNLSKINLVKEKQKNEIVVSFGTVSFSLD